MCVCVCVCVCMCVCLYFINMYTAQSTITSLYRGKITHCVSVLEKNRSPHMLSQQFL